MNKPSQASPCEEEIRKSVPAADPRFKTIEGGPRIAQGLCMNCSRQPDCMFFAKATRPVLACEEYSCDELPQPAATTPAKSVDRLPNPLKGLCATCEDAASCMYAVAGYGRWHCEEYR
jgi:hypothetical protein